MEFKDINKFVDGEIKRLENYYDLKADEELTLAMALKIGEELGELFNEVLAHKGYQRKSKLDKLDKKEIEGEFADVVLTTFMLARRFNIDLGSALKDKIDKIQSRNYSD